MPIRYLHLFYSSIGHFVHINNIIHTVTYMIAKIAESEGAVRSNAITAENGTRK